MNLAELRERYPHWTIRQDPDPDCRACKGKGEIGPTRSGLTAPCLCACTSEPHGEPKREMIREIGNAARRIKAREFNNQ